MKKILQSKSQSDILVDLRKRKKENLELLDKIEQVIKSSRGYIFKMPAPGTPIVVSMSGGADTTVTTAILLEEYGLDVYPYFLNRVQRSLQSELKSIKYFSNIFKTKYGNCFHDPIILGIPNPATEIKKDLTDNLRHGVGYPMRNSIILQYGVQYAFSLANHGIQTRNIFCSTVASDGDYSFHSTLTALRSLMLHVCTDMGDFHWQITSLAIEKELGLYFDKDVLVKWAHEHYLPLEKTRTCIENTLIHCGQCDACYDRKRSFEEAGVEDKTEYLDKRSSKMLLKNKEKHG